MDGAASLAAQEYKRKMGVDPGADDTEAAAVVAAAVSVANAALETTSAIV